MGIDESGSNEAARRVNEFNGQMSLLESASVYLSDSRDLSTD